jgi:hypothetical protein
MYFANSGTRQVIYLGDLPRLAVPSLVFEIPCDLQFLLAYRPPRIRASSPRASTSKPVFDEDFVTVIRSLGCEETSLLVGRHMRRMRQNASVPVSQYD